MINFIESEIKALAAHYIGSASEDQDISFSKEAVAIADPELHQTLLKFFLSHYREPAFSAFTYTSDELELNPVYNFVGNILMILLAYMSNPSKSLVIFSKSQNTPILNQVK